ncbi:hypothetical protein [Sulfitobacter mediterraneus]|jgi:hypothetical protein|uniref:Uncharacterized protein n=1 Tax=Sulfitobacter mediterraneus TaxID=83219 RepID=A0A2T6CHK5_9RHOB|nr:hypothetical protein [Sulfitobacter mediterraneus]KIN76845.1 hypothetical protein Z950_1669 [Sulfitobacter mediterraneus KCTC 32188]PTX74984.1 hypothetical protein C8N31_10287 [Sulfitobacter mediterraneus]
MIRPEPKKDQQAETHQTQTPEPQAAAHQSPDQQPTPLITDYASL